MMQDRIYEEVCGAVPEGARLLFAVEAGSRAWGFASEDSDYDVRFVFAPELRQYLTIGEKSFHVERTVDNLDLVGWDIRKFLRLLSGSNMSTIEWLHSPIIYAGPEAIAALSERLNISFNAKSLWYSHRGLAMSHMRRYLCNPETATAKKYLYVVRSIMVMQHLSERSAIPPVPVGLLMRFCLDEELINAMKYLMGAKLFENTRIPSEKKEDIDDLLNDRLDTIEEAYSHSGIVNWDSVLWNFYF